MLVTELGMLTEVRPEQYWNAYPFMLVTELGMVTEVAQGLHFITVLSVINNPSSVSIS